MASEQPFKIVNGSRRNISFPASSIELSNGTTAQAAVESLMGSLGSVADFYGVCSTAADVTAKEVSVTGFKLETGASVKVKFANTNTAANPTLNVNSIGAKPIYYRNAVIGTGYLAANRTYEFVYNGNQFELVGDLNVDTNNATAQNVSTVNATYPVLLGATADATANIGSKATIFGKGVKVNPSTSEVIATKFTGALVGNVTGNVSGSSGSCTGNAATATKLETTRNIDGVSFNGTANITHYGSCSTAAATVEKVVACTGFALATGAKIAVKFTVTNTAANPTLNVNSTGAKAIYYRGAAITAGYLAANRTYEFVYNGTQYELIGDVNTDTNNATAQNISTANNTYPVLLGYTANATASIGNKATLFSSKAKLNPSTAQMTLNNKVVPVVSSFDPSTGTLNLVSSGS